MELIGYYNPFHYCISKCHPRQLKTFWTSVSLQWISEADLNWLFQLCICVLLFQLQVCIQGSAVGGLKHQNQLRHIPKPSHTHTHITHTHTHTHTHTQLNPRACKIE